MKRHLLYNIIGIAAIAICLAACSSDSGDQGDPIPSTGRDLMRFSSLAKGTEAAALQTRASTSEPLKKDFLVSTYKWLGSERQTVMPEYQALYSEPNTWDIYGSTAQGFYQLQEERYWDLSAGYYRFHAIAPCPANSADINAIELSHDGMELPTAELHNETCTNGVLSGPSKETHYIAQVKRSLTSGSEAHDYDLIAASLTGNDTEINIVNGTSPTRTVALPFHHLTCKVRFGLYTTVPQLPGDEVKVKSVAITAETSAGGGIVYEAKGYQASTDDFSKGTFTTTFTVSGDKTLFTKDNEVKPINQCLKSSPWMLGCEEGMMQIPQSDIVLTATVVLDKNGAEQTITQQLTPNEGTAWTWRPGVLYTYYLNITQLDPIAIDLEATVTPWDEITIDLSIGLED